MVLPSGAYYMGFGALQTAYVPLPLFCPPLLAAWLLAIYGSSTHPYFGIVNRSGKAAL